MILRREHLRVGVYFKPTTVNRHGWRSDVVFRVSKITNNIVTAQYWTGNSGLEGDTVQYTIPHLLFRQPTIIWPSPQPITIRFKRVRWKNTKS